MARAGKLKQYNPLADEIFNAIRKMDNTQAIKLIGNEYIDVLDGYERSPIIQSVAVNNMVILEWLLSNSANVNHQDRNGWSALHMAAQEGRYEMAELLVRNGANPNLIDRHGNGPLWTAVMRAKGENNITNLLITAGSDIHHKNHSNRSPADMIETMSG